MSYDRIDIRARRVVEDVGRLTMEVEALEHGLTFRQLRIVVLWHFGSARPGDAFNAYILRDMRLLNRSSCGKLWKQGRALIAYEMIHRHCRPEFPVRELGTILGDEDQLTRQFHERVQTAARKAGFRPAYCHEGDIERITTRGGSEMIVLYGEPTKKKSGKKPDGRKNNGANLRAAKTQRVSPLD